MRAEQQGANFCYSSLLVNTVGVVGEKIPGHENLPNYEDCDSKFGIGFKGWFRTVFNPEQAKDFRIQHSGSENPKFGRNALRF